MESLNGISYFNKASQRASIATGFASHSRKFRKKYEKYKFIIEQWGNRMINSGVVLLTSIFLISCPVEIMVSYEMYRELLANYSGKPSAILVWLMGFFIVGLAAWVSHLIGKKISKSLYDWEVFNFMYIQNNNKMIEVEAEEKMQKEANTQFRLGIVFFVFLLLLVAGISWQRSFLTSLANGQDDFSLLEKILPIAVVTVEVFTGIYAAYIIKFIQFYYLKKYCHRSFLYYKEKCADETQMAYALLNKAKSDGEKYELSKDLKDVLYRMTFLSKANDDYVDNIDVQQCKIIVQNGKNYIPNVRVVGLLDNTQLTNSTYTNEKGIAFLHWQSKEPLRAIELAGEIFEGPFSGNSTHKLRVDNNHLLN